MRLSLRSQARGIACLALLLTICRAADSAGAAESRTFQVAQTCCRSCVYEKSGCCCAAPRTLLKVIRRTATRRRTSTLRVTSSVKWTSTVTIDVIGGARKVVRRRDFRSRSGDSVECAARRGDRVSSGSDAIFRRNARDFEAKDGVLEAAADVLEAIEDDGGSSDHALFARHLCRRCASGTVISGKSGVGAAFCCPGPKTRTSTRVIRVTRSVIRKRTVRKTSTITRTTTFTLPIQTIQAELFINVDSNPAYAAGTDIPIFSRSVSIVLFPSVKRAGATAIASNRTGPDGHMVIVTGAIGRNQALGLSYSDSLDSPLARFSSNGSAIVNQTDFVLGQPGGKSSSVRQVPSTTVPLATTSRTASQVGTNTQASVTGANPPTTRTENQTETRSSATSSSTTVFFTTFTATTTFVDPLPGPPTPLGTPFADLLAEQLVFRDATTLCTISIDIVQECFSISLVAAEIDPTVTAQGQRVFELAPGGGSVPKTIDPFFLNANTSYAYDPGAFSIYNIVVDPDFLMKIEIRKVAGNPILGGIVIREDSPCSITWATPTATQTATPSYRVDRAGATIKLAGTPLPPGVSISCV